MTRFYHILLFFLAPFCVIGAEFIVKLLSKREKEFAVSSLLLIVLVPYFLFQTGFVYEVTGSDSWSIPLSGYRMNALRLYGQYGYTDACSVYGAQWLSKNVDVKNSGIYADGASKYTVLTTYFPLYRGFIEELSNTTIVSNKGTVYLGKLSVNYGRVGLWNSSELSSIFEDLNKVYSNGGSEVYQNAP
jgi:uncharacterized membrane protein